MKKFIALVMFWSCVSLTAFAQGFYFDIGLGIGWASTKVGENDFVKALKDAGAGSPNEIGIDFGLKAGYGPLPKIPLYAALEFGGIGHRIYDKSAYIQFNSYILGPSLLFYPVSFIQLGGSFGYSYVSNTTDLSWIMYDSEGGFAWNVLAAFDLGSTNHGWLLGVKYFNARNTLKITGAKENASMVSLFVKYAYRTKTTARKAQKED